MYFLEVTILHHPGVNDPFLPTIGESGLTVEIGPVPQGCVVAEVYHVRKKYIKL